MPGSVPEKKEEPSQGVFWHSFQNAQQRVIYHNIFWSYVLSNDSACVLPYRAKLDHWFGSPFDFSGWRRSV